MGPFGSGLPGSSKEASVWPKTDLDLLSSFSDCSTEAKYLDHQSSDAASSSSIGGASET